MAYEAMNHAGFLDKNMIVILNDNQQACPSLPQKKHLCTWLAYCHESMLNAFP